MGRDFEPGNSLHEPDQGFLEYLKRTHPQLYQEIRGTERLTQILEAHRDYIVLQSVATGRESDSTVTATKRPRKRLTISVFAIFLLALLLRLLRVNFGLPYLYIYDETYIMLPALKMLKTGDFDPHFFNYPSLMIYLEFVVTALYYLRGMSSGILKSIDDMRFLWAWSITTPDLYIWGRSLVALFGAATVAVVYLIGSKAFDSKKAGVIGALYLAVSEAHIAHSIIIKVDVQTAFLVITSIYFSIMIVRDGKWINHIAAGILGGLAISSKYSAFWIAVPYMLACVLSWRDSKNAVAKTACGLLGLPFGFLLGTPYAPLEFTAVVQAIGYEARHYGVLGHRGSTSEGNILFFLKWLFLEAFGTPIIPLFAAAGLVLGFTRKKKEMLVAVAFPLIHFFYFTTQQVKFMQNMVPVLPFVALFAGLIVLAEELFKGKRRKLGALLTSLMILVAVWPAVETLKTGWDVHFRKDTRTIAVEWMKHNLPPGSKIAIASELRVFVREFSNDTFEVSEISVQNAELPALRKLGINYFVTGQFKIDVQDEQPISGIQRSFAELQPIKSFDGGYAYIELPIKDPKVLIYRI